MLQSPIKNLSLQMRNMRFIKIPATEREGEGRRARARERDLHFTGDSPSVDNKSFMRSATCGHMCQCSEPEVLPSRHPITPTTPLPTNVVLGIFALPDTVSRCRRSVSLCGERKSKDFNSVFVSLLALPLAQESKDRRTLEALP